MILVAIIYYFSHTIPALTWIIYCVVAPTVLAAQIDPLLFEALYASQHAIFLFARIPQILKNFSNKSTGQLSFLSCLMNFAGSIVRVFTSVILGSAIGVMAHGNTQACVLNVAVRGVEMHSTLVGVPMKTWQGGSGSVQGVTFSNIQVSGVETPVI
ncbi:mannose-P-dolichol utilization defect 1 protein homolog 2-like isoform X2 [Mercurialis annua]|uniref:mannose-P-dolichol utilization defect 1 protein homolog 2-like isoform X2 n=1 Tax=Mercurialis annua TaxID=3986 RepID=UPI0024AE33A3|nr:mannose-P-dolichol utilization defect 1 protein homolog 2-like isoform X2 [Mercurialis annua]